MSFQVYDEQGRIWPPGFRSQLVDDMSPQKRAALVAASAKGAQARAAGKGWRTGTLEHLQKPMLKDSP